MPPTSPTPEQLTLSSRRVLTPEGERPATLRIDAGKIAAIEPYDGTGRDLGSVAILPGLVDPHVHLNEPGRTEWEGLATGTAAAAAGGVTTLVDMPLNSSPVTTTPEALQQKRSAAEGVAQVDVAFHGGLVPGNEDQIEPLLDAGVVGVKAFLCHSGIDEFPAAAERELRAAMPILAERGVPLLAHAEIVSPAPETTDPRSYAQYAATRPPKFEQDAIRLLLDLCDETGCRVHIVHLAGASCLEMLAKARASGLPVTVETCPHYLTFAEEEIPDGATEYKCAPPIRDAENREGLWQGLRDGVIDLVATDHSPCPPEMKQLDSGRFDQAWGGIASLQLGLSATWTGAVQRGFDLTEVVRWMSTATAELVGIEAGIRIGAEANLVLFDPEATSTVRGKELHHRHPITPYEGRELRGKVIETLLRGGPPSVQCARIG